MIKAFHELFSPRTNNWWPQTSVVFPKKQRFDYSILFLGLSNKFSHVVEIIIDTTTTRRRTHFILINDTPSWRRTKVRGAVTIARDRCRDRYYR